MVKLPKSIIAKYGITKKAWQVYRGKKKAAKKSPKKHTRHARPKRVKVRKKHRTPTGETHQQGVKMARKRSKRRSVRHHARRVVRRTRAGMETRPGKVIVMATEAAAGGILSSLAVNKLPVISTQNQMVKAGVQAALGLGAVMFVRNRHAKSLGAGAVIAAVMGVAQSVFKVSPLAGPSAGARTLTPSEMARITGGQMGIPLRGMNMPLSAAPANAGFNRGGFGN